MHARAEVCDKENFVHSSYEQSGESGEKKIFHSIGASALTNLLVLTLRWILLSIWLMMSFYRKMQSHFNHRYYTNNTGLEAPLRGRALLIVPEVINFARCVALLPWLLAYLSKTVS